MKEQLLDKVAEIRNLIKNDDVSGSRMHSLDAFDNSLRLMPKDGFTESSDNELIMLLEQAKQLEQEFENTHPHFSATLREIVSMLSSMGI